MQCDIEPKQKHVSGTDASHSVCFFKWKKKEQKEEKVKVLAEFTLPCLDLQSAMTWRRRSLLVSTVHLSAELFFSNIMRPITLKEFQSLRIKTPAKVLSPSCHCLVGEQVKDRRQEVNSEIIGGSALQLPRGRCNLEPGGGVSAGANNQGSLKFFQ